MSILISVSSFFLAGCEPPPSALQQFPSLWFAPNTITATNRGARSA